MPRALNLFLLLFIFVLTHSYGQRSLETSLLFYHDSEGLKLPVKSKAGWEKRRLQILSGMQEAMGELPPTSGLPPLNIQVRDSITDKQYTRFRISFTAAENESVTAYVYVPSGTVRQKKRPAMLVLHETGDEGKDLVDAKVGNSDRALAKELARRGYVVIAPDYPSMGEMSDYDFKTDRYSSGTMKAVFNHMRSVDLLAARNDVDPARIGVIGHSLGGHNAIFAAAFDQRLKIVVSSCGWTLLDHYDIGEEAAKRYGGRLGPWAQERYMPLLRERYSLDANKIPFDFDEVIAALAPRPFFSNSPLSDSNFAVKGVREGIHAASEVYRFLEAGNSIQAYYPDAGHDFPADVREKAYRFIDKTLKHTPVKD